MKKSLFAGALGLCAALVLSGCASGPKVSYVSPDSVDTTTINYGSTDLTTTAQTLVNQMLASGSVQNITKGPQKPVVFIGSVTNNSDQHIDVTALTNAISTPLINGGQFQFVDMTQVAAVKKQLNYQASSGMVDPKTATAIGHQLGARYMLYGWISSINQRNSSQQSLFMQFTLKLMDLKTGVIIWQGEKRIRKLAQKKGFGW